MDRRWFVTMSLCAVLGYGAIACAAPGQAPTDAGEADDGGAETGDGEGGASY